MINLNDIEKRLEPHKVHGYLNLVSEAIREDSNNAGSLRKPIWAYLFKKFPQSVDYRDFLIVFKRLIKEGKLLKDENGHYRVESNVYREIWKDSCIPLTEDFKVPITPNTQVSSLFKAKHTAHVKPLVAASAKNSIRKGKEESTKPEQQSLLENFF